VNLPNSTDVFVIGGGPAGLAAAIAARRKGFDVILADSAVPSVDKACGEGIMPDGLAAARALGLNLNTAPGHSFRGIRFRDGHRSVQAMFPHGEGRGVRRTELHHLMTAAAESAGVSLAWGARISGICDAGVHVGDRVVRSRWIVGADGGNSSVRRWAGLDPDHGANRRYGFRRHYRVSHPGDFMEIHWGERCQLYITPVAAQEICVVLISRDQQLRLAGALPAFPEVNARLSDAEPLNLERGGVTMARRLRAVSRGNVALVGDASGSVDAVTGEGLCLLFQHALALSDCFAAGSLQGYDAAHRRIGRRPGLMSHLMLLLDARRRLRHTAMRLFEFEPALFARLLAVHVGDYS
jgi:flavin-dependent dehydrogenase